MESRVSLSAVCVPSEEVVAREVQGEFVIIPITSGVGTSEEEIFTLNETGKSVWDKLDGQRSLKDVAQELAADFEAPLEEIQNDVLGLAEELLKRKILTKN